jgi:hypothetical protein
LTATETASFPVLEYLWQAHLLDETHIFQNEADVSAIDPEKRSAFYDLCLHDDEGNSVTDCDGIAIARPDIAFFGITNGRHTWVVDLRDGHFEVNGLSFRADPWALLPDAFPDGGTYRLVFFLDREQKITTFEDKRPSLVEDSILGYRLGWVYELPDGRRWKQTIVVP